MENFKILDKRICFNCRSDNTWKTKDGYQHWYHKDGEWYCNRCNNYLFKNPRYHPITNPTRHRFWYHKRQIFSTFKWLTGYCSWCANNVYDMTCKRTQMHHWVYVTCLPWFGRIELCSSCHGKTTRKQEN